MFHLPLHPPKFHSTIGSHRYRSSYETSSSSTLTLLVQKRYRGTSELILDTDSEGDKLGEGDTKEDKNDEGHGLDDDGQGLDDEGQGSEDEGLPLGFGYRAARHRVLESTEKIAPNPEDGRVYIDILTYVPLAALVQTSPSPEWSLSSLPVSPSSPVVPSPIASPVATPTTTISVDEDQFLEGQLEIKSSHRGIGFRSLEQEQERATMTFSAIWRPILALEAWAGQTDSQMAALWHAIYDIQRENHDLRRQLTKER
ncbi:hypothetical protein Tco_0281058 [Tanacetum coccineum]